MHLEVSAELRTSHSPALAPTVLRPLGGMCGHQRARLGCARLTKMRVLSNEIRARSLFQARRTVGGALCPLILLMKRVATACR